MNYQLFFKHILILLFFSSFHCFANGNDNFLLLNNNSVILEDFFQDKDYVTLDEKLKLDDRELTVSVHYVDDELKIFDQAIVYEYEDDMIKDYLIYQDEKFINHRHEILADLSIHNNFFGFTIFFSYPTRPGFDIGFSFSGYFDKGRTPADPPVKMKWDRTESVFYKFVLDWDNL